MYTPRIVTIVALLLVSSAGGRNLSETEPTEPFSLTLSLAHEIVTSGEHVSASVKTTNNTNHVIVFYAMNPICDYSAQGHRVDGTELPRTKNGELTVKHCTDAGANRNIFVRLKPGEEWRDPIEFFSGLFDLSEPGGYVFQLSRAIPKVNDKAIVSNSVLLTVMPKENSL